MKKVIRLSESQLINVIERIIKEQGVVDVIASASDYGFNPTAYQPTIGQNVDLKCKTYKTKSELVLSLFTVLRSVQGQPKQEDQVIQSLVQQISKDPINGLKNIKTPEQMGSVLNAYHKKFKKPFYHFLNSKSPDWESIWKTVKKFISNKVKIDYCKTSNNTGVEWS